MDCTVCDKDVNIDGDLSYEGTSVLTVPGVGAAFCRWSDHIVHKECLAKSGKACKSCAVCEAPGCGADTSVSGTGVWVVKGSAELAPAIGTHAQERLCTLDYNVRLRSNVAA